MVPKQAHLFEKISLSRTTIARRIEEIGENISEQLQSKGDTFQYFSLAFDESCDMSDTAQLSIFIRAVAKYLSVHADLVGLISLYDTTRGVDVKETVLNALHYKIPNLSLSKLVGLTTDGAASMTGKENRTVALLNKYLQESDFTQDVITLHCFIHQESLCAQSNVTDVVVKCVNEIRAKGLKHRQFQSFLLEMNAQYKDLVYHSLVRWLSRGKVLQRFLSLPEEIKMFLQEKSPTLKTKSGADVLTLLRDNTWSVDLTFSIDITQHMNNLCIKMQGRNQLLPELLNAVDTFQSKLEMFQKQLSSGNMIQFKSMSLFLEKTKADLVPDFEKYAVMCKDLREKFSKRFQDRNGRKTQMNLFQRPLSMDIEYLDDADTQLELVGLRSNQVLHDTFQKNSLLVSLSPRRKDVSSFVEKCKSLDLSICKHVQS